MQAEQSLLDSLIKELKRYIQSQEAEFAKLVIADFEDCLVQSKSPIKTTYSWLKTYQAMR